MAKKIQALVKLQCPAGAATPAPPVGTALGPHGVNIMEFVKQFNARTQSQSGMVIPVVVTIFADRTFTFITKTPPAPNLLLKEAGRREGQRAAQPDQGGQGHPGPGQEDRRDQDGRPQRGRPRQRHAHDRRHRPVDGPGGGRLMPTQGKKFEAAVAKVDRTREYPIPDAVALVKGASFAKFDETVDVAVRLGVDPRHADQVVRGTVVLPHGTGKSVRVLVITQGERVRDAEAAGRRLRGHRVHPEAQGRLAGVRRHRRHARRDGPARPAGQGARPPRPDAEPQGRHRHHGRRPRRSGRSRPARSSSGWTRPGTYTRRSARCRSPPTSWRTTSRRSWTPSSGPSRPRPRAPTSAPATLSSTMGPGVRLDTAVYR